MKNDKNKIDEHKVDMQNKNATDKSVSIDVDELAQDFLNTRRAIQRMNHRRDAWMRR